MQMESSMLFFIAKNPTESQMYMVGRQLSTCRKYMFAMIDTVHVGVPNNLTSADQFVEFLQYNLGQWFNPNSVHFQGEDSNYWTDIFGCNRIFTNNGSESMNSALNHLFPSGGYISKATAVKGLQRFFNERGADYITFTNDLKMRKGGKNVLRLFRKFQKLASFCQQFQLVNNREEG